VTAWSICVKEGDILSNELFIIVFDIDRLCSWLQMQKSGFDSRHYQIFWEVVGLERGPISLESTIEELLGRKSSGSGLEIREYGRRDPSFWPYVSLYPQNLPLILLTSDDRSVGIFSCGLRPRSLVF
jgi:hypothetical protein